MSQQNSFKEQFPKNYRPEITDLEAFWNNDIYTLFRDFAEYILQEYDLRFGIPLWMEKYGWTYRIGKSGIYFVKGIQIEKNGFVVNEILVTDKKSYYFLLQHIEEIYQKNEKDFLNKIREKNLKQAERNKLRVAREKKEFTSLQSEIIPDKYNVFCWPQKLDIRKLNRLYMLDAKGIHDEILADEVGLTIYIRCKFGKEDMQRMEKNIIRCHGCGNELVGESDFRKCMCGYQYSYREYRRSFCRNNMPRGAAAKVFDAYIQSWVRAKSYHEKMILIDSLLHEFHVSLISGATHRPVAMNFIDGTRKHVEDIINNLAKK